MKKQKEKTNILIHAFFILFGLICIVPFMMVVSASFSNEADLSKYGFRPFPVEVDFTAYAYLFENPDTIINAYAVTIFITVVGTFLGVLMMSLSGYALSRDNFRWKKAVTWFFFFPTLFSGGMVAQYIINTKVLGLTDSIWALILPSLANVFHIIMFRTFFKDLPEGLFDAAKIDGAGEWRIYSSIALRLSTPVVATIAFLNAMAKWNEWHNAMLYIRSETKYPLQYLLQRMMMSIDALLRAMEKVPTQFAMADLPGENLRMALLVVCIGPMMLVFPFFQKYFAKGMTVGGIKG